MEDDLYCSESDQKLLDIPDPDQDRVSERQGSISKSVSAKKSQPDNSPSLGENGDSDFQTQQIKQTIPGNVQAFREGSIQTPTIGNDMLVLNQEEEPSFL